jgi:membrane-associated phospholipid phosphatase
VDPAPIAAVAKGYAELSWSPIWFAWRALTEYVQTAWMGIATNPPPNVGVTSGEIGDLLDLARFERADALGEILSQKDEFISYFMGLLGASPASRPQTLRLMHIANIFAGFTAMHFKFVHRRQRPSALCPPLMPPVEVPGHASYPSGHATQARLIAKCAALVLPATIRPTLSANLLGLAARIARNREIGGFHYKSDTVAGVELADNIFNLIEKDRANAAGPILTSYRDVVEAAKNEWKK